MKNSVSVLGLLAIFLFGTAYCGVARKTYYSYLRDNAIETCTDLFDIDIEKVVSMMRQLKVPQEPLFPCWYNCFLTEMGVKRKHLIDWNMMGNMTMEYVTDKYADNLVELYDICKEQLSASTHFKKDDCEMAYEGLLCEIQNWTRVGLPSFQSAKSSS